MSPFSGSKRLRNFEVEKVNVLLRKIKKRKLKREILGYCYVPVILNKIILDKNEEKKIKSAYFDFVLSVIIEINLPYIIAHHPTPHFGRKAATANNSLDKQHPTSPSPEIHTLLDLAKMKFLGKR